MLTLVLVVIFTALVFEFINGFHDTANSIATVVATKVLAPGWAVALAAVNVFGGFLVTRRMLEMFKKKAPKVKEEAPK